MRIGAHSPLAIGGERLQFRNQPASLVEQRVGRVAAHPLLEQFQMVGITARVGDRHLMRAPETFDLQAVDLLRAGPALWAAQHDHGPLWTVAAFASVAGALLNVANALQ